jgi:copper chaperone
MTKADKSDDASAAATSVLQINVQGMTCGGCEQAVKAAVMQIDGVVSCQAFHEEGLAIVTVQEGTADSKIEDAISGVGFQVSPPQG